MGYNSLTLDSPHGPTYRNNNKTTTTFFIFAQSGTFGLSYKKLRRPGTDISVPSRARLRRSHLVRSEAKAEKF